MRIDQSSIIPLGPDFDVPRPEAMLEYLISWSLFVSTIERCIETKSWLTNDGDIIPIKEMSSLHIRNTLALLRKEDPPYGDFSEAFIPLMEAELAKRYPPIDPSDERYDF